MYASSDELDTAFVARLIVVYRDGQSSNLDEGVVRGRYRDGLSTPKPLEPGKVYPMEIDMVGTSVAFEPGHRIRVHITSSHFPQFDRNPNTGEPFGTSDVVKVAGQTVHHDASRASHILLPVIPAAK
jgi:putative CocE/NonD family hydrolase